LEIGGKNKTQNQGIHHENHLVFSDDLEFVGESKSRFTYSDFCIEKSYLLVTIELRKITCRGLKLLSHFGANLELVISIFPDNYPRYP
jgi:hypothetical protein